MNDTLLSIRRSAQKFFSGTFLSRIAGMARDITMAYAFGTQPSIAAFMLAFRLAHSLRRLLGEGALQAAFIPEFEALRHHDSKHACLFFRDLMVTLALLLSVLIGLGGGVLIAFLWWGNLSAGNSEIVYLSLLMLPSLLFICLYGINASFLQCERIYFIPSIAPVAFNGIWIIAVLILYHMPAEDAMPWLAGGVILACLAQWLCTVPHTLSMLKKSLPSSLTHAIQIGSADLIRLGRRMTLGILGVAASQINNIVDSLFARFADPEGPAYLWYAIRLQQLPLALFGIALAGAILPPISRAIKAGRREDYHQFLHYAMRATCLFILPLTALLFVLGDMTIHFIFGRGDFGYHSTVGTTYCLWAYSVGLLPSALILVLAPACYAQNNYRLPAIASLVAMILNFFLNTLFILFFHMGTVSVALATSMSAWLNLMMISWSLSKEGTNLFPFSLVIQSLPLLLATLIAFMGTFWTRLSILKFPFLSETDFTSQSLIQQTLTLSLLFLVFGSIFYTSHWLIKKLVIKNLDENSKNIHYSAET